jgi:hypothetical protein
MTRKFDKYGFNRQYLRKPLSRRDPFPRDHLPFVSDFSVGSSMHNAATTKGPGPLKGAVNKGFKEAHRAYQKAKLEATKALRKEAKQIKKKVKSHMVEELEAAAVIGGSWLLGILLAPETGGASVVAAEDVTDVELANFARATNGGFSSARNYGAVRYRL